MRVLCVLLLCVAGLASAQEAQPVLLRLHPRVGDTLHTQLEQRTETSATMPGSSIVPMRPVATSVVIHSRTIVRSSHAARTTVLTIVDSATLSSTDAHAATQVADAQRALSGQQLILQLGADGTVESARDAKGNLVPRELAEAMAAMPAVFPKRAVSVGDQWMREMPLPAGGPGGARGSGHVRATFHLDSLPHGGAIAFVSMHGEILADSASHGVELSGSISGSMQLDRARGWMTDSRFLVILKSVVNPPASTGFASMRLLTRVTQRLRTTDTH